MWLRKYAHSILHHRLDLDLRCFRERAFGRFFFPLSLAAVVVTVFSGVEKEALESEAATQNILRPNFSIVDVRPNTQDRSARDQDFRFFRELYAYSPGVHAVLSYRGDLGLGDVLQKQPSSAPNSISREAPILLVTDGFFRAFRGEIVAGRALSRFDILNSKPVAVISRGLAEDLTLSSTEYPAKVFLNGLPLDVVGIFDLGDKQLEENHSLFVPLSLVEWLEGSRPTRITRFILEGDSIAGMEKLKASVDRLQLQTGKGLHRPSFELLGVPATGANRRVWTQRRGPLRLLSYFVILLTTFFCGFVWHRMLLENAALFKWRSIAGKKLQTVHLEILWGSARSVLLHVFLGCLITRLVGWLFYLRTLSPEAQTHFWGNNTSALLLGMVVCLAMGAASLLVYFSQTHSYARNLQG